MKKFLLLVTIIIVGCIQSDYVPAENKEEIPQGLIGSWQKDIADPIKGHVQRSEFIFSVVDNIGYFEYYRFGHNSSGELIQIAGFKGSFEAEKNLLKLVLDQISIQASAASESLSVINAEQPEWESVPHALVLSFELNEQGLSIYSDENGDGRISETEHYLFSKSEDDLIISCL